MSGIDGVFALVDVSGLDQGPQLVDVSGSTVIATPTTGYRV